MNDLQSDFEKYDMFKEGSHFKPQGGVQYYLDGKKVRMLSLTHPQWKELDKKCGQATRMEFIFMPEKNIYDVIVHKDGEMVKIEIVKRG